MSLQKIISEVKVQLENQVHGVHFNITAICPDGARKPGISGCGNVTSNDEVCGSMFFLFKTIFWCAFLKKKNKKKNYFKNIATIRILFQL
jgi:hypothetical protein